MATIGLKNLHYAILETDTADALAYSEMKPLKGVRSISITPGGSTETLYGDNAPLEVATSLGEISVEIELADIGMADKAAILGHTYEGGEMICTNKDVAPYVGLAFDADHSDGKLMYVKLLKGKFSEMADELSTREDGVEFATPKLSGAFAARTKDGAWKRIMDEQDEAFDEEKAAKWYVAMEDAE